MSKVKVKAKAKAGACEHCGHCVWDGVAYWIDDSTPVAQWISCDKCDWGNE